MLTAEIIAVGSELLTPQFHDTNSVYLTEELNALGIPVVMRTTAGDHEVRLEHAIRSALDRTPLIITIGGLGPTEDDLTRKVVAHTLRLQLILNDGILEKIRERYRLRGADMPANNERQALVPSGAEILENDNGTAPGLWLGIEDHTLILLPGPPGELKPMFERTCYPRLARMTGPLALARRVYRTTGLPESAVDARIAPIYTRYKNPETTLLSKPGQVDVHLRARAKTKEEAEAALEEVGSQIDQELGDWVGYGIGGLSVGEPKEAMLEVTSGSRCGHVSRHETGKHLRRRVVHRWPGGREADSSTREFALLQVRHRDLQQRVEIGPGPDPAAAASNGRRREQGSRARPRRKRPGPAGNDHRRGRNRNRGPGWRVSREAGRDRPCGGRGASNLGPQPVRLSRRPPEDSMAVLAGRPRHDTQTRRQALTRMRLFIAAKVPRTVVASISALRERLDPERSGARWVRPESLHLTLKFLGEVDPSRLEGIGEGLDQIRRAAFNVVVSGVGFFPNERSPRVFWLGIQSDGLEQLARDVEIRMVEAGFPPDERAFEPHLTLARRPRQGRIARQLVEAAGRLPDEALGTFRVESYHLYQSHLERSGATYTILGSYPLTGPDDIERQRS